jgi:hypothetical protein
MAAISFCSSVSSSIAGGLALLRVISKSTSAAFPLAPTTALPFSCWSFTHVSLRRPRGIVHGRIVLLPISSAAVYVLVRWRI